MWVQDTLVIVEVQIQTMDASAVNIWDELLLTLISCDMFC